MGCGREVLSRPLVAVVHKPKILGGEDVVITDESMGISQLLGVCARATPLKSTLMFSTHNAANNVQ